MEEEEEGGEEGEEEEEERELLLLLLFRKYVIKIWTYFFQFIIDDHKPFVAT